jgi:hypothetical protein
MRFYVLMCVIAVLVLSTLGCQSTDFGQSAPIQGASDYSLNGREIHPPNQALVENPYAFPVKITWQDKEKRIEPHGQWYAPYEGEKTTGPMRVWKLDAAGNPGAELTIDRHGRRYRVM